LSVLKRQRAAGELAAAIRQPDFKTPNEAHNSVRRRQAEVAAIAGAADSVDIFFGDDPTDLHEDVRFLDHVQPQVGDIVWVDLWDGDLLVTGKLRTAESGIQIVPHVNSVRVQGSGNTSSTSFVTFSPACTLPAFDKWYDGTYLEIYFTCLVTNSNALAFTDFAALVDSTGAGISTTFGLNSILGAPGAPFVGFRLLHGASDNIPADEYDITPRWKVSTGTATTNASGWCVMMCRETW
jgi:hypothetical protein